MVVCVGEGTRREAGLAPNRVWFWCRGHSSFSPDSPSTKHCSFGGDTEWEGKTPASRRRAQRGVKWCSEPGRRRTGPHGEPACCSLRLEAVGGVGSQAVLGEDLGPVGSNGSWHWCAGATGQCPLLLCPPLTPQSFPRPGAGSPSLCLAKSLPSDLSRALPSPEQCGRGNQQPLIYFADKGVFVALGCCS